VILVSASDTVPVPWKNGGGVTRELLRLPADGSDDWTLRISVADIDADGPFSPFPGIARWFAVLTGAGVRLRWPERAAHVHAGDPALHFDGADAPECTLFDGPTRDLNIMVRRSRATAEVSLAAPGLETCPGHAIGLGFFALRPVTLQRSGKAPTRLPALSLAWSESSRDRVGPGGTWWLEDGQDNAGAQVHTGPGYWIRLLAAR
jgi:environmental stress-induced protein Ves